MYKIIILLLVLLNNAIAQTPLGTEFTYQGNLKLNNANANGLFDFEFALYDSSDDGTGNNNGIATVEDILVTEGIFTTQIDFGSSVFLGDKVWIEINVRPGAEVGVFQKLLPRQQITAAPYAIHAQFVGINAIGAEEIQDGSVTSSELQAGSVGVTQILASEVQQRVYDSCPIENYMTGVNEDGTVNCAADQTSNGGGLTTVTSNDIVDGTIATVDLADNTITSAKIVAQAVGFNEIKSYQVQRRVGSCAVGKYINGVNEDGTVVCATDQTGSGSGLTVVTSGDIVDGTIATVDLADDTITSAKIVAQAVGFNEIKSYQVQRRVGSCAIGKYINGVNEDGTVVCATDQTGSGGGLTTVTSTDIVDGTIASIDLSDGAVTTAKVADGAITGVKISANAVGTSEIISSQVQRRVSASCSDFFYLNGIDEDGAPQCKQLPMGFESTIGNNENDSSIAVRDYNQWSGLPIVSYSDFGNLRVFSCSNSACTAGNTYTLDNTAGDYSSIAIKGNGYPVISYYDSVNGALKIYNCTSYDCSTGGAATLDDAGDVGLYTSIALKDDGNPIISYYDVTNTALDIYDCTNDTCSSGSARALDNSGDVGLETSIAIRNDGTAIISYRDQTNPSSSNLKVYSCNDSNCISGSAFTLDSTDDTGFESSIAIKPSGNAVISYSNRTFGKLFIQNCNNVTCSSGSRYDLHTGGVHSTSIAIKPDGNPVIAHFSNNNLNFYSCSNANCSVGLNKVITTPFTEGFTCRIAIGESGNPIASYTDFSNNILKVYSCGDPSCQR